MHANWLLEKDLKGGTDVWIASATTSKAVVKVDREIQSTLN